MTIALKQQIGIRGRVVAVGTIAAACLMCASGPASAQAVSHGNPIVRLAKKSVREAKLHNIAVNLTTGWAASPSGGLTTDLSVKFLFNDRPFSFESFRLSAVLTSTDLTTGARTKLLTRRNTIPYSLASGYGHTYGIWYRIDSWRKERFRMQLVELSDPKHPRELLSEAFGDEGGDCLPGRVTGVTPQGEAILVRPMLGERCEDGNLGQTDNGRILAVGADGQQRVLATRVNLVGPALVRGNFLLYRKGIRTRVANLTTGTFADYWNGVFGHIDMSENGSLLVSAPRAATYFGDFLPYPPDPRHPPKKPEREPSHPLLMFANGQPTTPTIVDPPSKDRVPIGTFCGGGYVKVVGTLPPLRWYEGSFESEEDDDVTFASIDGTMNRTIEGPAGVELRTASGEFVRTLGVIRKGTISAPICIGDRVVVPFRTGGGFLGIGQKFKFYPFDVSQ